MKGCSSHLSHKCVVCSDIRGVLATIAEEPGSGKQWKEFDGRWEVELVVLRVATTLGKNWVDCIRCAIYAKGLPPILTHSRGSIRNSIRAWATNAFEAGADADPGNPVVVEHQIKEAAEALELASVLAEEEEVRKEIQESPLPRNLLEQRREREERIRQEVENSMAAAQMARMEALLQQNEEQKALLKREQLAAQLEADTKAKRAAEREVEAEREAEAMAQGEERPWLNLPRIDAMAEAQIALAAGKISALEFAKLFVDANDDANDDGSISKTQGKGEKRPGTKPKKKVTFSPFPPKRSATYSREEYDRGGSSEYLASALEQEEDESPQSEAYMLQTSRKEEMEAEVEEEILIETARGERPDPEAGGRAEGETPNSPSVFGKLGSLFD